mgnify:CR=1 FL=1
MENLKPLTDFFSAIEKDGRISTVQIALYSALLHFRSAKGFINPVEVFRRELAPIVKISSAYTYHRCLHELDEYGI